MCKVVPRELIEQLAMEYRAEIAAEEAARKAKAEAEASTRAKTSPNPAPGATRPGGPDGRVKRCRAYLKKIAPSIEGQDGSDRIFQAARVIWNDFGLDEPDGIPLLEEYNLSASPPWDADGKQGYLRKWNEAVGKGPGPEGRGYKFDRDRPGWKPGPGAPRGGRGGTEPSAGEPGAPADAVETGGGDGDPLREAAGDPHRLARIFLMRYAHDDRNRLLHYSDEWFEWLDGRYQRIEDAALQAAVTAAVRSEFETLFRAEYARWEAGDREREPPVVRQVKRELVGNVLNAVKSLVFVATTVSPPCWLGDDPERCRGEELVACRNGLLVLSDFVNGRPDALIPPTPQFFNRNAVPLRFDPDAPEPFEWLKFLKTVFEGDPESIVTLQEWFGYCLTADTSQQKALMIIGPRRSGKGTICRVLKGLTGKGNYASLNLVQLAEPFGLEPLAGKTVAIVEDCRISDRHAADTKIVEQLLTIIGEGDSSVNRKNKSIVDATLRCRFTLCSNEAPRLKDPSLALPGRLVMLRLFKSFYGKEDRTLWDRKLKPELPAILLWAIEGWRRLNARGYFQQPKSADALIGVMEAMSSPVRKFIEDRCAVANGAEVEREALYTAFKAWCKESEVKPCSKETFGKELYAAVPTLGETRPRAGGGRRERYYTGLELVSDGGDNLDRNMDQPGPESQKRGYQAHWTERDFGDDN